MLKQEFVQPVFFMPAVGDRERFNLNKDCFAHVDGGVPTHLETVTECDNKTGENKWP